MKFLYVVNIYNLKNLRYRTNRAVFCLGVPGLELLNSTGPRHGATGFRHVRANTRLIVVKLVISITIQHAVYLENVAVCLCTREFVAGTVEAKDELFALLRRPHRGTCKLHLIGIHIDYSQSIWKNASTK